MATNNSVNMGIQENADGGQVKLGVTQRFLKWLGADITLTGSGSNTHTFPATSSTLLSNQAAEISALTEKTTLVDDDLFIIEDSAASNAKKKVKKSNVSSGGTGGDLYNYIINGGFDLAQRQTPGTLITITDNKCSADRWWVTRENADAQYQRGDATGESGLTSLYYGAFKKITNAGKLCAYYILEGADSMALRGKTVIFQVKMKTDSARTFRMGILELNSSGTMDTVPSTFISSFNADASDPTFGTNIAICTAAQSKSVTTSWANYSISVTLPATSKNFILAVWSDADVAANGILYMAEAAFHVGSTVQSWKPRLFAQELTLAERYCRAVRGGASSERMGFGQAYSTTQCEIEISLRAEMLRVPTVSVSAASDFRLSGASFAGITCTDVSGGVGSGLTKYNGHIYCQVASGLTAGDAQMLFDGTGNALLVFDAEITRS